MTITSNNRQLPLISVGILLSLSILLLSPLATGIILVGLIWGGLALFTPLTLLVVMLCLAPMRVLISTEAPGLFPVDPGQILLILFLLIWVLHTTARQKALPELHWTPTLLFVGGFVLVAGITGFFAVSLHHWLSEWMKWVQILMLILVVLHLGRQTRWQWIIFALMCSGIANAVIGIYEYLAAVAHCTC